MEDKDFVLKVPCGQKGSQMDFPLVLEGDQCKYGARGVGPSKKTKKKCKRRAASLRNANECKKMPQNLGMKVPNVTPISAHHHMAVNLDTDDGDTSTSYEASEDDVIHLLECDLSVWH